jgi:multidrug efflux system outer membrane protein
MRSPRTALLAIVMAHASCAPPLGGDASIREPALPTAFDAESHGPSIAQVSWREWFGDEPLNGLVAEALGNNHDLLIALQRIQIARAGVQQATGALLPQVGLSLGASVQKFGKYTMDGAGNSGTDIAPGRPVPVHLTDYALGLQSSWEIDLWGKLRGLRESAVARYLASVEGTNLVRTALVADVASAYYDLLALDHVREVLRESVARQQTAVEVVKLQKLAGRSNELAVQQFEAQLADTRASEREVMQRAAEAENRLNVLLGRYPQAVPRSKDVLFAKVPAKMSAGVPSDLLANRPDIRQAELEVRASRFDVKAARAAFFPSLTLTASLGYQAFNPKFLFETPESLAYSLVGGLVAPLVNRSGLHAQFNGAQANQIQAMVGYQRAILVAYVEVVNALSGIRVADEALALRNVQKEAMTQAVASADLLYRAGKATYLEALLAQQNSLRANLDLIEAWRRRHLADVTIYRALGGGWR